MKKIGIMSMQRVLNYGSFLQAYCLKKILEKYGTVEFVDYNYECTIIDDKHKKSFFKKIINNLNVVYYIKKKIHLKKFRKCYNLFLSEYLNISSIKNTYPKINSLVIGSDEVFNCMQKYPVGYSKNLFGKGYEYCDVLSYAASFGHTTYEQIVEKNINDELRYLFSKFISISVRDKNSSQIIKNLTGNLPKINLDPVLIGNFEKELENKNVNLKNYIVLYAYTDRLSKEEEKYIKQFAKRNKKKIVSLGFYQKIADYNLIVNPFDVLNYIKYADYVITDTFHGTVFSIKMNTKFCTLVRKSNYNKLNYLLEKLSHKDQMAKDLLEIDKIYNKDINFNKSNEIIKMETMEAINYFNKVL